MKKKWKLLSVFKGKGFLIAEVKAEYFFDLFVWYPKYLFRSKEKFKKRKCFFYLQRWIDLITSDTTDSSFKGNRSGVLLCPSVRVSLCGICALKVGLEGSESRRGWMVVSGARIQDNVEFSLFFFFLFWNVLECSKESPRGLCAQAIHSHVIHTVLLWVECRAIWKCKTYISQIARRITLISFETC